jgi:hypothetical protein
MHVQYTLYDAVIGPVTAIYDSIEGFDFTGVLVEEFAAADMPQPEPPAGTLPFLMINIREHFLYYDYRAIPESESSRIATLEQANLLLKAQNVALSERADFIEDVIAEMAMQIYA